MNLEELPKHDGYTIAGVYLELPGQDFEVGKLYYPNGLKAEPVLQMDGTYLWCIRTGAMQCINRKGELEFEPSPSGRTKAFLRRCRFASLAEAIQAYEKYKRKWKWRVNHRIKSLSKETTR